MFDQVYTLNPKRIHYIYLWSYIRILDSQYQKRTSPGDDLTLCVGAVLCSGAQMDGTRWCDYIPPPVQMTCGQFLPYTTHHWTQRVCQTEAYVPVLTLQFECTSRETTIPVCTTYVQCTGSTVRPLVFYKYDEHNNTNSSLLLLYESSSVRSGRSFRQNH